MQRVINGRSPAAQLTSSPAGTENVVANPVPALTFVEHPASPLFLEALKQSEGFMGSEILLDGELYVAERVRLQKVNLETFLMLEGVYGRHYETEVLGHFKDNKLGDGASRLDFWFNGHKRGVKLHPHARRLLEEEADFDGMTLSEEFIICMGEVLRQFAVSGVRDLILATAFVLRWNALDVDSEVFADVFLSYDRDKRMMCAVKVKALAQN